MIYFLVLVFVFVLSCQALPPDIERDSKLSPAELIKVHGYPEETHTVQTEDGYILTVYRIPHGLNATSPGPPALVVHGLLLSSADFVETGPEKALAYKLAEAGFDVWLGNLRGSTYSKKHIKYSTSSKKFWDFSWHENGKYDVPAMMDYILNETNSEKLFYIGHSMGTTVFYVTMSIRPEYNSKIRLMVTLAPIAYVNNVRSVSYRLLGASGGLFKTVTSVLGIHDILPNTKILNAIFRFLCQDHAPTQYICKEIVYLTYGRNPKQLNSTQLPVIFSHFPAGGSRNQFLHYIQEIHSGHFRQFDHGSSKNKEIYGSAEPPDYDLSLITAPIAYFYSEGDTVSDLDDVRRLYNQLPNVVYSFLVQDRKFSHVDYLWGIDANLLVYNDVIKILNKH